MSKRVFLVTLLIESDTCDDTKFIQDDITMALVEDMVIDTADYSVTHIFDVQEMPPMDNG